LQGKALITGSINLCTAALLHVGLAHQLKLRINWIEAAAGAADAAVGSRVCAGGLRAIAAR